MEVMFRFFYLKLGFKRSTLIGKSKALPSQSAVRVFKNYKLFSLYWGFSNDSMLEARFISVF